MVNEKPSVSISVHPEVFNRVEVRTPCRPFGLIFSKPNSVSQT